MTTLVPLGHPRRPRRLFRDLEDPRDAVSNLTPNWFASVMGTGIVATAAAAIPVHDPLLHGIGEAFWFLASVLLVVLIVATVAHWIRHPETARGHHLHPVMAHFYGAPPMALLTVGAGTAIYGPDLLGTQSAFIVDGVLWSLGTVLGVASAVIVPYLAFTRAGFHPDDAFGGWLMPVVPPMVSAATGALLVPAIPAGEARVLFLVACYGLFGMSLFASVIVITILWANLARHKTGAAVMVPTLWIVLGPLGQSATAANTLGNQAHLAFPPSLSHALEAFGFVYGIPTLGFAAMWAAVALAVTIRTARAGLPFALTWWSFTFPVGTCVTGFAAVAARSGSGTLGVISIVLFATLAAAWTVVAIRTFHGAVVSGRLLAPNAARKA